MNEFVLANATIVTAKSQFSGNVFVKNGKIVEVKKGALKKTKVEEIDLKGLHLLPGLIDSHVHFRSPGMEHKEDWLTGSKAALAGGVTTVIDMPNTKPATVDKAGLERKRSFASRNSLVNFGFFAGATPDNLLTVSKLPGIVGVKVFMGSSTGNLLLADKDKLEKLFKTCKKPILVHAESEQCLLEAAKEFKNTVGSRVGKGNDVSMHPVMRPAECAYEAVKEVLHLAKKYGTKVHICHVTSEGEVKELAKFKGKNVSAEVTPQHLFLTDKDYPLYGNLMKVNPPIRGLIDQVQLWDGIKKGIINTIGSDHAPHTMEEKMQVYDKAPSGMPGVQTTLPLLLNAVNEGKLSLEKVVELTSTNPAKIFSIKNKGQIKAGFDADFAIVNMHMPERVCHHYLWTKVNWSVFHGWVLKGWPIMTIVNGEIMYEWRERFGKTLGKEIKIGK